MPAEVKRKIIMLDKQPVVSLPRAWVDFWKLNKKKTIHIFYNSVLIVVPTTHPDLKNLELRIRKLLLEDEQEKPVKSFISKEVKVDDIKTLP